MEKSFRSLMNVFKKNDKSIKRVVNLIKRKYKNEYDDINDKYRSLLKATISSYKPLKSNKKKMLKGGMDEQTAGFLVVSSIIGFMIYLLFSSYLIERLERLNQRRAVVARSLTRATSQASTSASQAAQSLGQSMAALQSQAFSQAESRLGGLAIEMAGMSQDIQGLGSQWASAMAQQQAEEGEDIEDIGSDIEEAGTEMEEKEDGDIEGGSVRRRNMYDALLKQVSMIDPAITRRIKINKRQMKSLFNDIDKLSKKIINELPKPKGKGKLKGGNYEDVSAFIVFAAVIGFGCCMMLIVCYNNLNPVEEMEGLQLGNLDPAQDIAEAAQEDYEQELMEQGEAPEEPEEPQNVNIQIEEPNDQQQQEQVAQEEPAERQQREEEPQGSGMMRGLGMNIQKVINSTLLQTGQKRQKGQKCNKQMKAGGKTFSRPKIQPIEEEKQQEHPLKTYVKQRRRERKWREEEDKRQALVEKAVRERQKEVKRIRKELMEKGYPPEWYAKYKY